MCRVTGLKTLGRVDTHTFYHFFGKNIILCTLKGEIFMHFEKHFAFLFILTCECDWENDLARDLT